MVRDRAVLTYRGIHEPVVSREVWKRVQDVLKGRPGNHRRRARRFAFTGLITCEHRGCALTAVVKKEHYVYYHCTGYRGKCDEPYVREEVLEERFADLLGGLHLDSDLLNWLTHTLRASRADERRLHDEAIVRLQEEHGTLQRRIDAMYVDKLDGSIDSPTYVRLHDEWRSRQAGVLGRIVEHQLANEIYLDEGAALLELASRC